jgi:hypothetical protein
MLLQNVGYNSTRFETKKTNNPIFGTNSNSKEYLLKSNHQIYELRKDVESLKTQVEELKTQKMTKPLYRINPLVDALKKEKMLTSEQISILEKHKNNHDFITEFALMALAGKINYFFTKVKPKKDSINCLKEIVKVIKIAPYRNISESNKEFYKNLLKNDGQEIQLEDIVAFINENSHQSNNNKNSSLDTTINIINLIKSLN